MRFFVSFALFLTSFAQAQVISPNAQEVRFSLRSSFTTALQDEAGTLVIQQARHLFGYMQNPETVRAWGLNARNLGIGAPRWEPEFRVLSDEISNGQRQISYSMSGLLLLEKTVAATLLQRGQWEIEMPYQLDEFWDPKCTDAEHKAREEFWYFNDVFRKGCEHLRREPLARSVVVRITPATAPPANLSAGLDILRGDNGNGEYFDIMAINGFDESAKKRGDYGRLNFKEMNAWFRDQGFTETVLSKFKNRPVHLFEKALRRRDGSELKVRVTRLLVNADIDMGKNVTFAKFLKNAFETADVVIYEGHSGMGANLDIEQIEQRLLLSRDKGIEAKINFERAKSQLFFFDACSSYSYYLGMFQGRKNPGTLAVMTNGVESLFGNEIPMTKRLYRALVNVQNDDLTWRDLLEDMETPLRGNTFLLNVDLNR